MAFCLLTAWTVQAQVPAFSARSPKLLSATGWQQNKVTGQWVENKNVIDDRDSPPYWAGHTPQSFNWIRFASLSYGSREYMALLFEKPSGSYKNETAREEWQPDLKTCFFIMEKHEFDLIKKLVSEKKSGVAKISSLLTGCISDQEKETDGPGPNQDKYLLAAMAKVMVKPSMQDECMIVTVKVTEGKTSVRFLLPTSCFIIDNFIKTAYFEAPYGEFAKILEFAREP